MKIRICVLAPHPDDEVLGVGGTLARHASAGHETHVVIVTRGTAPHCSEAEVETVRREAAEAHTKLGVTATHFLDLPAASLDIFPHRELNSAIAKVLHEVRPDELYLPFVGDIHVDHSLIFHSAMVAIRPNGPSTPSRVYTYETLSETNWNAPYITPGFHPNHFVDISSFLPKKLEAMACFSSQLQPFPHERSLIALESLANLRGANIGRAAAEGFVVVRTIS